MKSMRAVGVRGSGARAGLVACAALVLLFLLATINPVAAQAKCLAEVEPNNEAGSAQAVSEAFCLEGQLEVGETDNFAWTFASAPVESGWSVSLRGVPGDETRLQIYPVDSGKAAGATGDAGPPIYSLATPAGSSQVTSGDLLLAPGSYLLALSARSGAGGYAIAFKRAAAQQVETEPNDTIDQATVLAPETTLLGDLSGSQDYYRCVIGESEARRRWVIETSTPPDETYYLALEDAQGAQLLSSPISGSTQFADIGLAPGDYIVHLTGASDGSHPYTLRLTPAGRRVAGRESEPNDTLDRAQPIAFGKPITGQLGRAGDTDYFALEIGDELRGKRLELRLETTGRPPGLCLMNSAGGTLQCRDTAPASLPDLVLPPGRYTVSVSGAADPGSSYRLVARLAGVQDAGREAEPNDGIDIATPLESDGKARGRLVGNETDVFALTVDGAPRLWQAQVHGSGVTGVTILDRKGDLVGASPEAAGDVVRASDMFLLPGVYSIKVSGENADYALEVRDAGLPDPSAEHEPNQPEWAAERLRFEETRTGKLVDLADVDYYRFSLSAAALVALEVTAPAGGELDYAVWSGNITTFTGIATDVPAVFASWLEPGDYGLRLRATRPVEGRYRFRLTYRDPFALPDDLEPNDEEAHPAPLPASLRVSGMLEHRYEGDWFALPDTKRPTRVRVEITAAPGIEVAAYDGETYLASSDSYTQAPLETELSPGRPVKLNVHGLEPGPYTIKVSFEDGPQPQEPVVLPLDIAVGLGDRPVAAFWIRGQRLGGEVHLVNRGSEPLDLSLDARSSDFQYQVELSKLSVRLAPGAEERVPLDVVVSPDAWGDNPVQIAVRARTADGGTRSATGMLIADTGAVPLGDEPSFAVPGAMRGGFDVAATAFGGKLLGPRDEAVTSDAAMLFDGVTSSVGYLRHTEQLPAQVTVEFGGDRSWPIAGIALNPQVGGSNGYPPDGLRDFDLLLSDDGVSFEPVLSGQLSRTPVEQLFLLPTPRSARAARLLLNSNHSGGGYITLGEWKVIAVPGEPAGVSLNIGDPARGGHVVYSMPVIGKDYAEANALLVEGGSSVEVPAGPAPEWVIGFDNDRAAQIVSLEWVHGDSSGKPFPGVKVAASLTGPLGPWRELGSWSFGGGGGESTWRLPEPVWARFLRFTASDDIPAGEVWQYPAVIRVLEHPIADGYLSILGEWGFLGRDAIYEATVADGVAAARPEADANDSPEAAEVLRLGDTVAGEVEHNADEDWYAIETPASVNTLTLTLRQEPFIAADATLETADGQPVALRSAPAGGSELKLEAEVEPNARYLVRITEPPRSIAVAYDTSMSLAGLAEIIKKGLRVFADDVETDEEFVNVMNFEQPFILDEWSDQPWVTQSAILAKTDDGGSSDIERSVIAAARALSERRGARALLLLTDASSPSYAIQDQMWSALRTAPPHIFAVHLGAGDADPAATATRLVERSIMQDLAAANAGHYAWAPTQTAMDVTFSRAAAWLRRPARYLLDARAWMAPPPAPGSIEVAVVPKLNSTPATGDIQPTPRAPRQAPATELILDASGSMLQHLGSRRRIEVARTVLKELVTRTLPPGAPLALRVFGTDQPDSCQTYLPVPLTPLDRGATADFIDGVTPVNLAKTPIAASLRAVADDLREATGPRVVVLVTDGEETCGGDPRAEIEALVA
ncbi:MAG: hypothetical protein ACTHLT_00790, partial [Devosia sp.]